MLTLHSFARRSPHYARSGYTIVEALVTLVLLAVAVLALSGTSTAIAHLEIGSTRAAFAAAAAESRFEILRSTRCTPASGSETTSGVAERWIALPTLRGEIHEIVDTVRISTVSSRPSSRTELYRSSAPC